MQTFLRRLGFNLQLAQTGVELMHMIRKGQIVLEGSTELCFADQFYALTGKIRPV